MPNKPDNLADNLLERAALALRDAAVPEGPKASVLAKTLAALEAAERPAQLLILKQRIRTMKALSKLAVAAVLLITVGGVILWSITSAPSVAFADVLKGVRSIQSVQYRQTTTIDEPGKPSKSTITEILISGPSRMRYTMDGQVAIMDKKLGKLLLLDPKAKLASLVDLANIPSPQQMNLLERFEGMPENDGGKPIGQKQIGGVKAEGFEMADGKQTLHVWVNKETRLPVLVEGTMSGITIDEFVWNPLVDEAAMSLTPPEGYKVASLPKLDMSPPKETDIAAGLKALAELNGGTYPDGIDMAGVQQVMRGFVERKKKDKELAEKMQADGPARGLSMAKMWMYIDNPKTKNGSDWHYAGAGVPLGQPDRPIFWYLPAGAANYRVINGDLSAHDVAPADLPRIPSTLVVHPAKMAEATTKP